MKSVHILLFSFLAEAIRTCWAPIDAQPGRALARLTDSPTIISSEENTGCPAASVKQQQCEGVCQICVLNSAVTVCSAGPHARGETSGAALYLMMLNVCVCSLAALNVTPSLSGVQLSLH